jgi:hypothetical protein
LDRFLFHRGRFDFVGPFHAVVERIVTSQEIPWSAELELRERRRIAALHAVAGLGVLVCVALAVWREWIPLLVAAMCMAWIGSAIHQEYAKLGQETRWVNGVILPGRGMLANKPAQTCGLTEWLYHLDASERGFFCLCGAPLEWTQARRYFEERGEREVLHCGRCGRAHYRILPTHSASAAK